jgi:two-component system, NarL family, sensor histidine kinase UhpB
MNLCSTLMTLKAKIFLFMLLFISTGYSSSGQSNNKMDSLLNVLKNSAEDTNKVNTLNLISRQLYMSPRYMEGKKYVEESLALAEKLNFKKGLAVATNLLGAIVNRQGNYTEASKIHLAALKIFEELGDKKGISNTYHNIGHNYSAQNKYSEALKYYQATIKIKEEIGEDYRTGIADIYNSIGKNYNNQGNYSESLKYLLAALKIHEETGDKRGAAVNYTGIGNVYRSLGNYSESLLSHVTAKKLYEETGNKEGIAKSHVNIGNTYRADGNYPEALKNYMDGKKMFEESGNGNGTANALVNIGEMNLTLGNFDEALKNFQASLKLYEENKGKSGIAASNLAIGNVYTCLNKHSEAKQYLLDGLSLSKELESKEKIMNAYEGLSKLDSAMGNFQSALMHYQLYTVYKDSMYNETSSGQIAQMKEQYESEKKDREILQLSGDKQKLESEKQISALENEKTRALHLYSQQQVELLSNEKKLQLLQIEKDKADFAVQKAETDKKQGQLVVLNKEKDIQTLQLNKQKQAKNFLIAGIASLLVLSFFLYRNYRTRNLLKLQTLRNKIASDLHDDVGSTLSSISIFSQMAQAQSKEVIPALETIGDSSRKMLDAMADIVWTINPENDQFEKIIMRMRSFAYELLGAKQIDFEFVADEEVSDIKLPMEARKNLYLIFKEATNNMVKYADASKAMFSVKGEKDKLTMMISDNGKGFDITKESLGNGLKNMKKRAMEIGAQLLVDSAPGSGTTIKLELAV